MILYVKAGCPWCRLAEEYLNKRGYKYERMDVRKDPLVIGNLVLPDFGPDELEHFLKQHNILP
jgi:glutaredoxin